MQRIYDKCCGIDVHKKLIVACFKHGNKQEIKEFGATTKELLRLADWLIDGGCEIAAMESTGSYWKPLYNVFEGAGLKVIVVNAQHIKNVPGRKTDASDAEWIADLVQHGLVRASYIPDRAQRELRELLAYRRSLVIARGSELNRLQKMLEGGNIKLSGTLSNINGKSSRNILSVILSGETVDQAKLEQLIAERKIHGNIKASNEQLLEDLQGVLTPMQRRMMLVVLEHVDEITRHIEQLDDEINDRMDGEQKRAAAAISDIPGIADASAKAVISVIGTDMSRFPTDAHIASWAGLCPGNHETAKKRKSGKTRKGNALLRSTLVVAAHSAVRNKSSFLYARFQRISARRGKKRAYVAIAHTILIAIYHILKDGVVFTDLGAEYYNQFNKERKINAYVKKLKALGCEFDSAMITIPA